MTPHSTAPVCDHCGAQYAPSPGGSFPPVWVHACEPPEPPGPWEPCSWHETDSHEPCPCDGGDPEPELAIGYRLTAEGGDVFTGAE